ncbi:MAG: toprim domain-containing protein [Dokdonella sp.]
MPLGHPKPVIDDMTASSTTLIVIEAPGKVAQLARMIRAIGLDAQLWASGGHFRQHSESLWPLGIFADGSEPGRIFDELRFASLRHVAVGRRVLVATDADQEGDVIARDVRDATQDIASSVERVRLHTLDLEGVRAAFARPMPVAPSASRAGDARRIVDRLIGHCFSRPGLPVGRVFTALLQSLQDNEPVIGHVTLTRAAGDGGPVFTARIPITPSTRALWDDRAQEKLPVALPGAREQEGQRVPWDYAQTLLRGALSRPALFGDGKC